MLCMGCSILAAPGVPSTIRANLLARVLREIRLHAMIAYRFAAASLVLGAGFLQSASAEGVSFDRLRSVPQLYQNESNPLLQEIALQGQLQTQFAAGADGTETFGTGDRPEDCTWGDIEVRRFRLGMRARMFRSVKLHALWDLHPDLSPGIYQRTAETHVTYSPCAAFNVSAGKVELKFSREQEISSREYLTFERSQLVNQFYGGELAGAWVVGKDAAGRWLGELGAYSNDRRDEWSHFGGGTIILAKIGCNYTDVIGSGNALAELHFLHNTEPGFASPGNPPSPPYSECIAISNSLSQGRFGLQAEALWGRGTQGRPDVWGISAIPSWSFTEKLQGVALLEYAHSRGPDGIFLPSRYEAYCPNTDITSGDSYVSLYSGLNYHIHGHKLKLMSGVKYARLAGGDGGGDFNGWTWLAGLRMAF